MTKFRRYLKAVFRALKLIYKVLGILFTNSTINNYVKEKENEKDQS